VSTNATANNSSSSQRRRLLASLGGGTASVGRSDNDAAAAQLATWEGYWLPTHSKLVADDDTPAGSEVPGRYLGAAPGHNKLIGGLLLHTTRKVFHGECAGKSMLLAPVCA
jgi:hypothetical protein